MVFLNVTSNGHWQTVPMLLSVGEVHLPELPGKQSCLAQRLTASGWHFSFQILCWALKMVFCAWRFLVWWLLIWLLILLLCFEKGDSTVVGTSRLRDLYDKFEEELGNRQEKAKAARPPWEPPKTKLDEDLGEWRSLRLLLYYCLMLASWEVSFRVPTWNTQVVIKYNTKFILLTIRMI